MAKPLNQSEDQDDRHNNNNTACHQLDDLRIWIYNYALSAADVLGLAAL
ncbi:hypothetical protein [Paenibacillus agricola]|uniref:Uncharacterized protein n=1 Tax=Paenibacillus agricola TaxID=2716264 RepID=A0ABX0J9E9_9BACL|nr:hypothetical protein [Paenibacillus agricola]NHN31423.1 hypothetical protein [Paenibacillus agricola]